MTGPLVDRLKERFPGIVIYDRNEEARREESDQEHPYIPQVAFVDVLFHRKGTKEAATIRCFHQHRYFNYDLDETQAGSKREEYLLNSMLDAVDVLRTLPKIRTPIIEETPACAESDAETAPGPETADSLDPETS